MEIVNIKRLKAALRQGELPARETAKYVAAQGALMSLMFIPSPADPRDWAFLAHPLLAFGGVYYCYRCNGGELGRGFAERYLTVGWVVGCRVALVLIPIAVVGLAVSLLALGRLDWLDDPHLADGITFGFVVVAAFIYWRIGRHIGDLQRAA